MDGLNKIAKEMAMAMGIQMEEQIYSFIIGLIRSGDLVRYYSTDKGRYRSGFSYIPYRDMSELRTKYEDLEQKYERAKSFLSDEDLAKVEGE